MSVVHDDEGFARHFGCYFGQVADNADPLKLGRVRVTVPGLCEPSGWALPVGGAHSSGAKGLGGFDVPPKDAAVLIGFHAGDIDHPYYHAGWKGTGEQVSVQPGSSADVAKIKVYESDRFLIVLNGAGGSEEILIQDKVSGDHVSMKPAKLEVTASAKVTVIAPQIELGEDGLGALPLVNGVVVASGIDPFTGMTYGVLGSASNKVTAAK